MSAPANDRARLRVLALISAGTMINYLDRTVLGVAAPRMTEELQLTPEVLGVVFSAFSWSYAVAQIPGGWFLDRFGSKLTYFLAVTSWSFCTLLHGLTRGVGSLIACRVGLGVAESPCFPVNSRIVATWFPPKERARATAVYTVGEYLGLACFGPVLYWVADRYGWRTLFVTVGLVGVAFGGLWWRLYREPDRGPTVPRAQHALRWADLRRLLGYRQIWGASLGQFGGNTTLVFFLTWFPTYLATERQMDWIRAGVFAVLPFLAAACGVMVGGWWSDALLERTGSRNLSRKLPIVLGLVGASTIVLANFVSSDALVIAILSAAFFSQGMTGLGWTVISEIAPEQMMGLTGGIFNFAANLAGVVTPIVIGVLTGATGSFYYALLYVGAAALMGALSYVVLLGNVERIVISP